MSGSDRPALRVISGDATAEEVAAIVAVLTAAAGGADPTEGAVRGSRWSAPHTRVRGAHPHGPGAWRASGLPRPR